MLKKNQCIAVFTSILGVLTVPSIAIAKDIESYEDYKMYCSSAAYQYGVQSPDCEKYKAIFEQRDIQENKVRQRNNNSIRRRSVQTENNSRSQKRGYIGINPGAFFPDTDVLETGAGISLYGGTKFNPNFAADFEIALLGGSTTDPLLDSYGVFAAFINPRFIVPFDSDKEKSASLYLSPGIGISNIAVGNSDVAFSDETRATWQAKGGVSAPVSNKMDIFGQLRYASQFQENTVDFFGVELGLNLNL